MYHSVAGPKTARWIEPRGRIDPARFRRQMRFLAAARRVISLSELVDVLKAGRTPPRGTVVITFDDGYLDNLEVAAPILAERGLPATIFLPTGYISRCESQWVDRMHAMLIARSKDRLSIDGSVSGEFDLRTRHGQFVARRLLHAELLEASFSERETLLHSVSEQLLPLRSPPRLTMNWDEVRRLRQEYPKFEIGVHTRDHSDLRGLSADDIETEIHGCIADVRRELGLIPAHFSFPYSRWSAQAREIVVNAGLQSAVADDEDVLITARSDPYFLPRVECPSSMTVLRYRTSGAYPPLGRRRLLRTPTEPNGSPRESPRVAEAVE